MSCFLSDASDKEIVGALTPEFVSDVWRYTKENYSDKGIRHADAIVKLAAKYNIPERAMAQIINSPKSVRQISDQVATINRRRNKFLAANRRFIAEMDRTGAVKLLNGMQEFMRGLVLFKHGPVVGITHLLDVGLTLGRFRKFARAYYRGFRAYDPAFVNKVMEQVEKDPEYDFWRRHGLPIGRDDNILPGKQVGWAAGSLEAGSKPLRLELAKQEWARIPEERRTPLMAQRIAEMASHATASMRVGEWGFGPPQTWFGNAVLAPLLTVAKGFKTIVDPIKTVNTYTQVLANKATKFLPEKFRQAPPKWEDRYIADRRTMMAGRYLGGVISFLAVNDVINRILEEHGIGPKHQRVNFFDPSRPDWMSFRVGPYYIKTRGSMEVIQLLARMFVSANPYTRPKYGAKSWHELLGRYAEYKATPAISGGLELTTGRDIFGRPVPWSSDPGDKYHPRYSIPEYALATHTPIFVAHATAAFYEGMRAEGVHPHDIKSFIHMAQKHPEIFLEAGLEGGAEFLGLNLQKERGKRPYQPPQKGPLSYMP